MATFYEIVSRYVSPYYLPITIFAIFVIFSIAAYYLYQNYLEGEKEKDKNAPIYQPMDDVNGVRIYFFTADWCPHCKAAKPTLSNFEKNYDGKTVKGNKIHVIPVDCTDSSKDDVASMIDSFSVTSFPTIKMVKPDTNGNEKKYEFDAKITQENLENFINSVL